MEPDNFNFFGISIWGIGMDYSDVEFLALEKDQDYSIVFEVAPKHCISHFLLTMRAT